MTGLRLDVLYRGPLAQRIAACARDEGGMLTEDDLAIFGPTTRTLLDDLVEVGAELGRMVDDLAPALAAATGWNLDLPSD